MTSVEWLFKTLWDCPKDKLTWYIILDKAKEMEKQQMEISDEEIEKAFTVETSVQTTIYKGEIAGAKWYREQLKQRK